MTPLEQQAIEEFEKVIGEFPTEMLPKYHKIKKLIIKWMRKTYEQGFKEAVSINHKLHTVISEYEEISFCKECYCMTKSIRLDTLGDIICGKCKTKK